MIRLGDKVKDKYTGFVGIAVARTEYINGCVQFGVLPRVKDGKCPEAVDIDEESLVVVKPKRTPKEEPTGGRSRPAPKMRGF